MTKPRKGAAFGGARNLDPVRARRGSAAAAGGNVTGRGLTTLAGGQIEILLGDFFYFGSKGEVLPRNPAKPLAIAPGSPPRLVLQLDNGLTVTAKGLRPSTSTSVKINSTGELISTPTLDEVTEPGGTTGTAALARKANTGDPRFPIAVGTATLVLGTIAIAIPEVVAGSTAVVSHRALIGTAGLLGWSVTAGVGITITSASALDVSTVSYAVWKP